MSALAGLLSATLILASGGMAQADPSGAMPQDEPPVTELESITVTGQPRAQQAQSFVETVAAPPRGRGLARWDQAVCVGTVNMSGRYAQFMIDRVSAHALALGLEVGEPGCRPNIAIYATDDADALATQLVRDNAEGFRPAMANTDLGSRALRTFQASDAPVRWWHVSLPVSVDTGEVAVRLRGEEPPAINVRDASRLRSNIRDDLARVVIILDMPRIGVAPFGALSDYVALVALAQIDPAADTSAYSSILNLFSSPETHSGLTDWDSDYLHSLYDARRDRARASQQAREIVRGLAEPRNDPLESSAPPAREPQDP